MSDEIEDNGGGSGFGWFLVGLGIGAAIGVLYAPQAGTETRENLAEGAREAKIEGSGSTSQHLRRPGQGPARRLCRAWQASGRARAFPGGGLR
jgi:hypothetical protein